MQSNDETLHDLKDIPVGELVDDTWIKYGEEFVLKGGRFRVQKLLTRGRVMLKWIGKA